MTTLIAEYAKFVIDVGHRPELIVAGVQRIHRNVTWDLEPAVFFDKSMSLEFTGYTQSKIKMLQRNYFNQESVERARADLDWRIKNKKYGSGAFTFRGIPKTGTKQDFCLQSGVISYYPQLKSTTITIYWRTAELLKRFRGDIVFLRDFILPMFNEQLEMAPPMAVRFIFENATFHPMYCALLVSQLEDWKIHFNQIQIENPKLFRSICYWNWRYFCDTSASIDSYSSARQVRIIATKLTPIDRLTHLRRYTEKKVKAELSIYPISVQRFYE